MIQDNSVDLNVLTTDGYTPLVACLAACDEELALELVASGRVDLRASDKHGYTGLHYAAKMKLPCVAAEMLSHGADPNARNHDVLTHGASTIASIGMCVYEAAVTCVLCV